ncbi:MAG: sugar transferase, partial [Elsteraceae bacterium]
MNTLVNDALAQPSQGDASVSYLPRSVRIGKRLFDLVVASLMLVATAPLFPLIALIIRLESKGPALFRQWRVGMSDPDQTRLFHMIKFRSMRVDAEAGTGAVWASKQDPRITRVGRFLRKTRLDELPQLWNVLRGDMSLVGPRPERPGI